MNAIINDYMSEYFEEVNPKDFYRDIFPEGELQQKGIYEKGKYNAIAVEMSKKGVRRYTVTDGLEQLDSLLESENFIIMSPISYVGKQRTSENARYLYALAIDLDGIEKRSQINDLFYQIENKVQPKPTYCVASGNGLHLYYVFEIPIPLFGNVVHQLSLLRHELIRFLWNRYVTSSYQNVQYESLFQGFRLAGGVTKAGDRTKVFRTGEKVTLEYLNHFVNDKYQVKDICYKSSLTLAQAKEKYPEWYEERIIKKRPKKTWTCKRDLFDWWYNRIQGEKSVGHRYFCMMCLAVYAKKCGISREELEEKAFSLLDLFDEISTEEDNRFTEYDITKALELYNDDYITFPIDTISQLTNMPIQKNKRNYRKQSVHMKIMSSTRDVLYPDGEWRKGNGRKPKKHVVAEWRLKNPNGSKAECKKETGLSYPTIRKWWNEKMSPEETMLNDRDKRLLTYYERLEGIYGKDN